MKKSATPPNISCLLNGKEDTRDTRDTRDRGDTVDIGNTRDTRDREDTVDIGNTRRQKEHKGNNGTQVTQGNTEETVNTR